MRDLDVELNEIQKLAKNPSALNDAEGRLSSLIEAQPPAELAEAEAMIQQAISRSFLPKRQKRLNATLAAALGRARTAASTVTSDPVAQASSVADAQRLFRSEIHAAL